MSSRSKREANKKKRRLFSSPQLTPPKQIVKSFPETTPTILSQDVPKPGESLEKEKLLAKFPYFSRKKVRLFLGSAIVALFITLVTSALQIAGVIEMGVAHILLFIAWLVVVVGFFVSEQLSRATRKRTFSVVSITAIIAGIALYSFGSWMVKTKAEAEKKAEIDRRTEIERIIKPPTYTEGVDFIDYSTAGITQRIDFSRIKTPRRFLIANIPATLYVEDGKPYMDVELYNRPNQALVRLVHNKFMNRPEGWDMNQDDKAFEVINEKGQPVLQIIHNTPSHIVFAGLFFSANNVPILSTEIGARTGPDFGNEPYPLERIFKYPESQYKGQRR